ncbi:hypothetical protein E0H26_06645 [Micromonospora zingiberis]|uniref:Uncharacterized protein n=1 Tax=Micromonospora zingiberis TaxID=2053011 RepID=A0A4R0GU39_9ACTN|nr:hypothetical protein E0H26_06645 [Micromonospora zingiberis]
MTGRMMAVVAATVAIVVATGGCAREPSEPPVERWSRDGRQVDMNEIESYAGLAHCGWQSVRFLDLSWPPGSGTPGQRQYVRDPEGALDRPALQQSFEAEATLPPDAAATGYERDGMALWLADSDAERTAYLVDVASGKVESWPRADPPFGCD